MTAIFVWERNSRGHWAPSLFYDGDDIPAAMRAKENTGRYVLHPLTSSDHLPALTAANPLAACAAMFPPPAPEPPEPVLVTIETYHAQTRAADVD